MAGFESTCTVQSPGRQPGRSCYRRVPPSVGPRSAAPGLLLVVLVAAGCDSSARGADASAAGPTTSVDVIVSAQPLDEQGEAAAARAADELFPLLERQAAIVKEHDKKGGVDCPGLASDLEAFAEEKATAMAEIVRKGGGTLAVRRALAKKFGERYETLTDELIEAIRIDCKADERVAKAAKRLDP